MRPTAQGVQVNHGPGNVQTNVYLPAAAVPWPLRVGAVPALASAFQARPDVQQRVAAARHGDRPTVPTQVLSGGGGVGKSQLAAQYAMAAIDAGRDLVVWADASQPETVVATYARAAGRIQVPGTTGGRELDADAAAFLDWLGTTDRSWLIVLDDIADTERIAPWWPTGRPGAGWVLATTRLRDAALSGAGRTVLDIDGYSPGESLTYLRHRLGEADRAHLLDDAVEPLAAELGQLPLALAHAAAYLINEEVTCGRYRQLLAEADSRLESLFPRTADADGYGRRLDQTLLLALDAAQQAAPDGLIRPVMLLAAVLDPAGQPVTAWRSPAVTAYLTRHRQPRRWWSRRPAVDAAQVRTALRVLHRYGLLTYHDRADARAVRVHALTARAGREAASTAQVAAAVRAGADALLDVWPEADHDGSDLTAVLRANTECLAAHGGAQLWRREPHPVLVRAGENLLHAGLHTTAVRYWTEVAARADRYLGPRHPDTIRLRATLATAYWQAGKTAEAVAAGEAVLADAGRILGPHHPTTVFTRTDLARAYWRAGRTADAIAVATAARTDAQRFLGSHHATTLRATAILAAAYWQGGRLDDAVVLEESVVADREHILGPHHPDTINARGNLAVSYQQTGRVDEAVALEESVVADRERILGPHHPLTLTAQANLGSSYSLAGRATDAVTLLEAVLAEAPRRLGPEHPNTLNARSDLAIAYRNAGRDDDAIALLEAVLADRRRILGAEHPDTLTARSDLAASYWHAGRAADAVDLAEGLLTDRHRILGADHPDAVAIGATLGEWRRHLAPAPGPAGADRG